MTLSITKASSWITREFSNILPSPINFDLVISQIPKSIVTSLTSWKFWTYRPPPLQAAFQRLDCADYQSPLEKKYRSVPANGWSHRSCFEWESPLNRSSPDVTKVMYLVLSRNGFQIGSQNSPLPTIDLRLFSSRSDIHFPSRVKRFQPDWAIRQFFHNVNEACKVKTGSKSQYPPIQRSLY